MADQVQFFMDSGAGQCMCSCVEAFSVIRPCAILVVGVSGSLPIHGIGTANFIVQDSTGKERIWKIHNCLLSHRSDGEEEFNLISISQILRTRNIEVSFGMDSSVITVKSKNQIGDFKFDICSEDGLYHINAEPISSNDWRFNNVVSVDFTLDNDLSVPATSNHSDVIGPEMKSPSRLGTWFVKVLWMGTVKMLTGMVDGFGDELAEFCNDYIAPLSIPAAKKTYQVNNIDDMSDLSIRFFGIGSERLERTLERSIGLTPMVKVKGKMRNKVPIHNFPQGMWKQGKTPRVAKGIVHGLHRAAIGEAVFTDTFEVEDSGYRYGQAYVDYRSKYGEVIPMKSRKQVGRSFAEFCARHFTPLILIRDNIGEHVGGDLLQECLNRSVKSAFICPYKKQQNYAEGYLGRITALATYGMVYSGAPMFMWRWCIACAVFINNITATFFSMEQVWATPYEIIHNEPFPDSSIVVPFGCGVLVLLNKDDQGKFQSRCALMIFVHYAVQHPLYTYAVYSPRTKRILYRQDCIFLTNFFPMRAARSRSGIAVEGDAIIPYRAPESMRKEEDEDLSFCGWDISQPLPDYQDHVSGHKLSDPLTDKSKPIDLDGRFSHFINPNNPKFGPPSVVKVPRCHSGTKPIWNDDKGQQETQDDTPLLGISEGADNSVDNTKPDKTVGRLPRFKKDIPSVNPVKRRPVKDRWYLAPVEDTSSALLTIAVDVQKKDSCDLLNLDNNMDAGMGRDAVTDVEIQDSLDDCQISNVQPPSGVGELDMISKKEVNEFASDEIGAIRIQGVVFYDTEFGWCRVTGWGVECGVIIAFYVSLDASDIDIEEQYVPLDELIAAIRMSPIRPVIPRFEASRQLKVIEGSTKMLCYRHRSPNLAHVSSPPVGSSVIRMMGAKLGSYNGKVLTSRVICRVLRAQETMFKYGTMIPRNDAEASRSPEAIRWLSGKQLEWLRLQQAKTFETKWNWSLIQKHYPGYAKCDIGHMFFIYDYKYSGEHRVRLVFDGSRQSSATYNETYAPTVRSESVRLFHIFAVEYAWHIQQYDVPQAFLRSEADCDIFCYPPNGFAEYPGQLLKLSKMLYGSKQAAALWYNLINTFLLKIGFQASEMDPCFYRRAVSCTIPDEPSCDAIIILHVDDMRVAGSEHVLTEIYKQLFKEFEITISDSGRFLGMDTDYNLVTGVLRMHMSTYIQSTVDRFAAFDVSKGIPFREIVGSLLWIVLCIMGPELLRVKDLARRSNNFTIDDYNQALVVLRRIYDRRECGIIYKRGGAGKETVPSHTRLGGELGTELDDKLINPDYSVGDQTELSELKECDLYKLDFTENGELDIQKKLAPINKRFTMVAYSDASFAVGEAKQSVSGFIVYINGIPLLWGSLKQTVVVDSTCSAEYVASSICCKQVLQAENMLQFLQFTCPKPYTVYTDSQACLHIANSSSKLGKVRHVEIRYHLVRCLVISGDIQLMYCITEDMVADIFTKIVSGAQDNRLSIRFYNDCGEVMLSLPQVNLGND